MKGLCACGRAHGSRLLSSVQQQSEGTALSCDVRHVTDEVRRQGECCTAGRRTLDSNQ